MLIRNHISKALVADAIKFMFGDGQKNYSGKMKQKDHQDTLTKIDKIWIKGI